MKKALLVKEEFLGREIGHIEAVGNAEEIASRTGHYYSKMEAVDVPSFLEELPIKGHPAGSERELEFWFKDGEVVYVDPEDETWTHHPEMGETVSGVKLDLLKYKVDEISKLYLSLQEEVYGEMKVVFGTDKSDSASADEATYRLWIEDPAFYAGQSFLAKVDTPSYAKGDVLDSEADISAYATEMLAKIKSYALWRKQKERDFAIKKASIENS